MADGEKLLTDEEMQAIEDVVASGGLEGGGYNVGVEAKSFDIASKDNRPDFDTTVLEQINERFHRHLRVGLAREHHDHHVQLDQLLLEVAAEAALPIEVDDPRRACPGQPHLAEQCPIP